MAGIRNTGVLVSGIFHLLILLIPVSMNIAERLEFKDIELFVLDETLTVKKTIEKPKIKQPQVKIEKTVIQEQVIEPTIKSDSKEAVLLPQQVEEPVQQRVEAIKAEVAPVKETVPIKEAALHQKQSESKDVEFGSEYGPKFLYREMPVYPMLARRLGKEGRVVLRLTIDANGKLLGVEVIEGMGYGFTESAVEAIKRSTFLPAIVEGRPVTSRALLPIRFTLRRD